jgi:hypothetical protein
VTIAPGDGGGGGHSGGGRRVLGGGGGGGGRADWEGCEDTTVFVLRWLRSLVEGCWGFGVGARDAEGDEDSDRAAAFVQRALHDAGAATLCVSLVARGIQREVQHEAVLLVLALLFREGGNAPAQASVCAHLANSTDSAFFVQVMTG